MNCRPKNNFKGIAREKLLGKYTVMLGAILIVQLIYFIVGSISAEVVDQSSVTGMIMYFAISVITGLIGAVFTVGEKAMYMKIACKDPVKITDIFEGFKGHADKAIIVQFLIAVKCILFLIPAFITLIVLIYKGGGIDPSIGLGEQLENSLVNSHNIPLTFMLVIFIILGLIGSIYVRLVTAQCFYVMLDYPDESAMGVIQKSRDMMKGRLGTYLYLVLSFVPIILLGLLSLGVALVYIEPYMGMTLTEYYMNIVGVDGGKGENIDIIIAE